VFLSAVRGKKERMTAGKKKFTGATQPVRSQGLFRLRPAVSRFFTCCFYLCLTGADYYL
jgi:hypothetical protein